MSIARTDTRLESRSTGLLRTTLRLGTVALALHEVLGKVLVRIQEIPSTLSNV